MEPTGPRFTEAELRGDLIEALALQIMAANQHSLLFRKRIDPPLHHFEQLMTARLLLGGQLPGSDCRSRALVVERGLRDEAHRHGSGHTGEVLDEPALPVCRGLAGGSR